MLDGIRSLPLGPRRSTLAALTMVLMFGAGAGAGVGLAAQAPSDTLVLVNGDPITVADLDEIVMTVHRSGNVEEQGTALVLRHLEKKINDYLIIQDALVAGMDQDSEILEHIAEQTRETAIQAFVRDHLTLPQSAPEDSVRAYFERYYWQIQFRQLSVRTMAEAEQVRAQVVSGADMDALAQEISLDSKRMKGGLHNLLYWADVENHFRDAVRDLQVGEISGIFPVNEAFAFVRVEKILPVNESAFEQVKNKITSQVHGQLRQRAWDEFVASWVAQVELEEEIGEMMAIASDSLIVLRGEFLEESDNVAIQVVGGPGLSGTDFRQAISHEAMLDATRPFAEIMARARDEQTSQLVLAHFAEQKGYFNSPEVEEKVQDEWEKVLVQTWLNDTVAAKIRFKQEEFDQFYAENKERFRGPDEVRLDILILDSKENAEEASARLSDGADFGYIFQQYNEGVEFTPGKANFIKEDQLSQAFRDQIETMEVGQSSQPTEMAMGWIVFQLDARRQGAIPPLEAVEMEIRRIIYQEKFNIMLDDMLQLLKENSEIVRFNERIELYFDPEGEG